MHIDQARHDRSVATIDHLICLGEKRVCLASATDGFNPIAAYRDKTFKRLVFRTGEDALGRQHRQTIGHRDLLTPEACRRWR